MPTLEQLDVQVQHLREVMELRYDAAQQALKIQAKEYERRLDSLNGEAQRLRAMQETYVNKEVYEDHHLELHKACDDMKARLDISSGRDFVVSGLVALAGSVVVGVVIHLALS